MAELDEELRAYYEELERQRQEERQRRRQELARAARKMATRRVKKEVKRRAGAYAAEAAGSLLAYLAPILVPLLIILLIIAVIIFVVIVTITAACNPSSVGNVLSQAVAFSLGPLGALGGIAHSAICAKFQGFSGLAGIVGQGQRLMCQASQGQVLASEFNVPYPAQESPALVQLTSCIERELRRQNLDWDSRFTYEKSNEMCNYTRGTQCGPCAHKPYSCHYGGRFGTRGAEAVDYGNEAIANEIIKAAQFCGAGFWLNEGDHVHVSTASCSGDGGDK